MSNKTKARSPRDEVKADKYGRNFERSTVGDVDFQLTVAPGLIPDGMVPSWFSDHISGRIQQKIREYWVHVVDPATGANITRQSGSGLLHLMMLEKEHVDNDEKLRMERYYDNIGDNQSKPLNVEGIDTYSPLRDGAVVDNKIRVRTDPFAL